MANVEIDRRHRKLLMDISDDMEEDSAECNKFVYWMEEYVGRGILAKKETFLDKLKALEQKGVVSPGNYDKLKEICNNSGNQKYIKFIEDAENDIKRIQKEEVKTDKPRTEQEDDNNSAGPSKAEDEPVKKMRKVEDEYEKEKKRYQEKLIDIYKKTVVNVSVVPLMPLMNKTNVKDVYVSPLITIDNKHYVLKDEVDTAKDADVVEESDNAEIQSGASMYPFFSGEYAFEQILKLIYLDVLKSKFIQSYEEISLNELFQKEGKPVKEVFVLGETGTGKSNFCKNLVNRWCEVHSEKGTCSDDSNDENILKKFEFLFYISLRFQANHTEIKSMLQKSYGDEVGILSKILEKDSNKCLIVIDGLDEWCPENKTISQFQTTGLPIKDQFKDYTLLITSRPWKTESLEVSQSEMQHTVKLQGVARMDNLIMKTFVSLKEIFPGKKIKDPVDFRKQISNLRVIDYTPLMIQQLICLWDSDIRNVQSRCNIHSGMLKLYFDWADQKCKEDQELQALLRDLEKESEKMTQCPVPRCLEDMKISKKYKYVIDQLSRLAHNPEWEISDVVRKCSLKLGLMTAEQDVSELSSPSQCSYSFVHPSVKEFFAGIYIAIEGRKLFDSAPTVEANSLQDKCSVWFGCRTFTDIERSNMLSMVCGLEPRLSTHISYYIYRIICEDKDATRMRTTLNHDEKKIFISVQKCITSCIQEHIAAPERTTEPKFYIADVILENSFDDFRSDEVLMKNKQFVRFDLIKLLSVTTSNHDSDMLDFLECVSEYSHLDSIQLTKAIFSSNLVEKKVEKCVQQSAPYLKLLDVSISFPMKSDETVETMINILPEMTQLHTIKVTECILSHDSSTQLVSWLADATNLHQVELRVQCEHEDNHEVDMSRHEHLQCLRIGPWDGLHKNCIRPTKLNTTSLETCVLQLLDCNIQILDTIHGSSKLKYLNLEQYMRVMVDPPDFRSIAIGEKCTKKLISLLPALTHLETLVLCNLVP